MFWAERRCNQWVDSCSRARSCGGRVGGGVSADRFESGFGAECNSLGPTCQVGNKINQRALKARNELNPKRILHRSLSLHIRKNSSIDVAMARREVGDQDARGSLG